MKKIITDNIGPFVLAALAVGTAALVVSLKNRKQLNPPTPCATDTPAPAVENPAAE